MNMVKVKSSKEIKDEDVPNNMLWLDLYGFIKYLEFQLEEMKRVPFIKRNDELKYQMKFVRKEIKYLTALFNGDLK